MSNGDTALGVLTRRTNQAIVDIQGAENLPHPNCRVMADAMVLLLEWKAEEVKSWRASRILVRRTAASVAARITAAGIIATAVVLFALVKAGII